MKNFELRNLVTQYKEIINKQKNKYMDVNKLSEKLAEIEHKYFHETGRTLKSDLKENKEN